MLSVIDWIDWSELLWAGLCGLAFVGMIYLVGRILEWVISEIGVE